MRISKQLMTLHRVEQGKEQKTAQILQQARSYYNDQKSRLEGIEAYRLEYMRNLQNKANVGMTASDFSHYQTFLKKLDDAYLAQQQMLSKAEQVCQQRQQGWLLQKQKLRSVELLIEKEKHQIMQKENRIEQKMFDEFAMQQFYRKKMATELT